MATKRVRSRVLRALHVPGATLVMSAIILTAVLSALNSGLFASSRMLMALAVNGDAPRIFSKLDARGVPASPANLRARPSVYERFIKPLGRITRDADQWRRENVNR
jgi:hypothetical protein